MDEGITELFFNSPFLLLASKWAFLLQLGLIVHVYKTGRPFWWIWVLLMFPLLGGLAYAYVELLPEQRRGQGFSLARFKTRSARIRHLRDQVEESDTVQNRVALAELLRLSGQPRKAQATILDCLQGPFRDDPYILGELARIKLDQGCWEEALAVVNQANCQGDKPAARKLQMLHARARVGLQHLDQAELLLRDLAKTHLGEEARFRLAALLAARGNKEEARVLWEEITKKYRKSNVSWRRSERQWFKESREALKALKKE